MEAPELPRQLQTEGIVGASIAPSVPIIELASTPTEEGALAEERAVVVTSSFHRDEQVESPVGDFEVGLPTQESDPEESLRIKRRRRRSPSREEESPATRRRLVREGKRVVSDSSSDNVGKVTFSPGRGITHIDINKEWYPHDDANAGVMHPVGDVLFSQNLKRLLHRKSANYLRDKTARLHCISWQITDHLAEQLDNEIECHATTETKLLQQESKNVLATRKNMRLFIKLRRAEE